MGHTVFRIPTTWREPINIYIPCRSRLRRWAYENAITLTVVTFFFVVTWLWILGLSIYVAVTK